ncbi:glycosyl transferase family 4 [Mucilaginibacter yixingensis]|uniref:Glycosyl transferase family 4 n=2 Tax=Mucilaginibacter yixingensis TaxID=1295612 RepID=A0A2T5JFR0_9SPHI|nr:glycosyl transferase family 4 [Mucilaginibacter yixingensis]
MQRIRMSLPYFKDFGWEVEVVTVDPKYSDLSEDELLLKTIPLQTKIHYVRALPKKLTSKIGLGSIALRSLWFYKRPVDKLLRTRHFDLIYFSTTQFPVCILGAYWKRKFKIPYVIDMQDPWHSDYYRDKPKHQRPTKFWFSYRLNKYLEPRAMRLADGVISVSEDYIATLQNRYPCLKNVPAATITFGAFGPDMDIALKHQADFPSLLNENTINLVYVGRGGADMRAAITPVFSAFKKALLANPDISRIHFYFIGTSYAAAGTGVPTIAPLAAALGVATYVTERTDRISYYHTLCTLLKADALFIPGSDDPRYTASKLYPYLLTGKPLLTMFNAASPALNVLKEYGVYNSYNYTDVDSGQLIDFFQRLASGNLPQPVYNATAMHQYSAREMTHRQCLLFDNVINSIQPADA